MDKRTQQLSIAFGALIACAMVYKVVWPTWIEPLTTIDARIATAQEELDGLRKKDREVRQAKEDYRELVERVATFDATDAQNAISVKLNNLVDKHNFHADTSRRRGKADRKTKIIKSSITVKGKTDLASAIRFLRDVAELPELIRVGKPTLTPVRRSSRKLPQKGPQLVNMTVPIEYWVLPQDRMIGRLEKADLIQPERLVRHDGRDYSNIWKRNPLTEVIPAPPLKVTTGRDITVEVGVRHAAMGSATGGTPPYKFRWEPSELVDDPTIPRPKVTGTEPGEFQLTLRVTDAEGVEGSSQIKVTVRKAKGLPPPEEKKPRKVDTRWRDRKYMQLAMTLSRTEGDRRIAEVMIHNIKNKQTDYYAVGDEFNGGELIYVHSRGGLVYRGGKYYMHPIGDRLDAELSINDAGEYPRFQLAAQQHGKLIEAQEKEAATASEDKKPTAEKKPNAKKVKPAGKTKRPAGKSGKKASTTKPPAAKKKATPPAKVGANKTTGAKKSGAKKPVARNQAKPKSAIAGGMKQSAPKAGKTEKQEASPN